MMEPRTSAGVREGVRSGVLAALAQDFELIGARTARRLVAAGLVGIGGAVGATLLISGHPFGHHPPWHVLVLSTVWSGLLVVSLSLAFLQIRTPTFPIGRSAAVGVLGLGLAGLCGFCCPDQHFLDWWTRTTPGIWAMDVGGLPASALCFGLMSSLGIGIAAVLLVFREQHRGPLAPILPATALFLLLLPGVALQSVETSLGVLVAWVLGTGIGSYAGVAVGLSLRSSLARR